jgi:hypothetical protein
MQSPESTMLTSLTDSQAASWRQLSNHLAPSLSSAATWIPLQSPYCRGEEMNVGASVAGRISLGVSVEVGVQIVQF